MYHLRLAVIDADIMRSFTSGLRGFVLFCAHLPGSWRGSGGETHRKRIYSSVVTTVVVVIALLYASRLAVLR